MQSKVAAKGTTMTDMSTAIPRQVAIRVSGATCGGCARKIQQALETLPGVSRVEVQLPEQLVQVTGSAEPDALLEAIRALNYGAELATPEQSEVVEPPAPAESEPEKIRRAP